MTASSRLRTWIAGMPGMIANCYHPYLAGPLRNRSLDAEPEASRAADRRRLAHVPGRMEERDAAQHRGARPAAEGFHESLRARAERAFARGALHRGDGDVALPVVRPERADDLAR